MRKRTEESMRKYVVILVLFLSTICLQQCRKSKTPKVDVATDTDSLKLIEADIELPRIMGRPEIIFPEDAIFYGKSAVVWVKARIDKDGRVHDVEVAKSPQPVFNKYAQALAYEYRFQPGKIDGKISELSISWPIEFKYKPR